MRADTQLFLDDHRGVYIPRDFAECIKRECLSGVSDDDMATIAKGPHDNEWYWDAWTSICDDAIVTDENGDKFTL